MDIAQIAEHFGRATQEIGKVLVGQQELVEATLIALEAMVEWMMQRFALTRHNALGLASVLVDLRITQIVNEVSGVHALLSHEAIREAGLKSNSV